MHYKFTQKYSLSLYKSKPFMDNNFSAQVKEIISFSREEALRLEMTLLVQSIYY
jgi:hypothetical protein